METIVIAVIVVSVLVVLLLVFTGRINIFGGQLKQCAASGGVCASTSSNCEDVNGEDRAVLFEITDGSKQCPANSGISGAGLCCSGVGIPSGNN